MALKEDREGRAECPFWESPFEILLLRNVMAFAERQMGK
jgi:hypothetical protein